MSVSKQGKNHPMFGKQRAQGAGSPSQLIEVLDLLKTDKIVYESISSAAKALGIKQSTISAYFHTNQKTPYKGRFKFTKIKSIASKGSSETSTQEV